MGPPGNRGSWGPCVPAHTQKKPIKGTRGISCLSSPMTPGPHDPLLPGGPMSCQSAHVQMLGGERENV
ncbi:unnamed protein product [Staurois parvus]|uniref:Uncharacterized protein n=1 Tax=Staurois parvus TaxID=386267 RepID=A0ABN9G0J7_9NEOB|nr:unnamed protein product [Staurois parvus]